MSTEKTIVRVSFDLPKALRNRLEKAAVVEGQNFASAACIALSEWTDRVLSEEETMLPS